MRMASKCEWGEDHRREALRRTYEIAAELIANDDEIGAELITSDPSVVAGDEFLWRKSLMRVGPEAGFTKDRIDREVRRVRALAARIRKVNRRT